MGPFTIKHIQSVTLSLYIYFGGLMGWVVVGWLEGSWGGWLGFMGWEVGGFMGGWLGGSWGGWLEGSWGGLVCGGVGSDGVHGREGVGEFMGG